MTVKNIVWSAVVLACMARAGSATAQTLGTFRWQLRPYCNVLTLTVTAIDGNYRLEGTDDQCGGGSVYLGKASVVGMAFPNPDGTIGFGLTIVVPPSATPVHVDAALVPGACDGRWSDDARNSGDFVLTPGAGTGGDLRPLPRPTIPARISLLPEGGIVARGAASAPIPTSGPGSRMMWHAGKGAFRAGDISASQWDEANVGRSSAAFGTDAVAAGIALGFGVRAGDGDPAPGGSVALGYYSQAPARQAVAIGSRAAALGFGAMALGEASATGERALAFGEAVNAGGRRSIVLGHNAETTAAATGSIVLADESPNAQPIGFQSFAPNQFLVRAAGGIQFYSNADLDAGVALEPGGNAWLSLSDAYAKHLYRDLDGRDVLARIAAMPVREWSYTSQDPSVRHIGPTAQDFKAAFGLGSDPKRIATIDADGVALAAVKALEARTRAHDDASRDDIATLRAEIAELRARLAALLVPRQ